MIMKKFTLVWLCLMLTTAFALAKDYHLYQTQILDGKPAEKTGGKGGLRPGVWVLVPPDGGQPEVFEKFDSEQMESWLNLRARGNAVHIHASPLVPYLISPAQRDAFGAFCKAHEIKFVDDSVGD
jgi:hypothetical protein